MTILKYPNHVILDMPIVALEHINGEAQSRPRTERQVTYFCRLCRKYKIKARKAHLQNAHNAKRDTVTKRSNNDLVNVIFVESR